MMFVGLVVLSVLLGSSLGQTDTEYAEYDKIIDELINNFSSLGNNGTLSAIGDNQTGGLFSQMGNMISTFYPDEDGGGAKLVISNKKLTEEDKKHITPAHGRPAKDHAEPAEKQAAERQEDKKHITPAHGRPKREQPERLVRKKMSERLAFKELNSQPDEEILVIYSNTPDTARVSERHAQERQDYRDLSEFLKNNLFKDNLNLEAPNVFLY